MNMSFGFWMWVSAFLTLCVFSFLYKDNPFYKFAEHLFVGASNGYLVTIIWHGSLWPQGIRPIFTEGNWWLIIALIIGMLYFTRFFPRTSWLVRIPIAIVMGYGTGAAIPATIQADIMRQIQGTVLTPQNFARWNAGSSGVIWTILLFIGVACTLSYFYFSREHKGVLGVTSRIGVVFIMIGFGAAFGYTVMARISLLIGRLQFLLGDWLGVLQ